MLLTARRRPWTKVQYEKRVWRRRLRSVVKRSGLVVRVLVLSVTNAGFKAKSFVKIGQSNIGDNVPSLHEDVAGIFARVHSRIRLTNGSEVAESAQGRLAADLLHGAAYPPWR
jgi:hypothetical protein